MNPEERGAEVEMLSSTTNSPVIRAPGRSFPGILVQGDSFAELTKGIGRIIKSLKEDNHSEAIDEAEDLLGECKEKLSHYESVLNEKGFDLPYTKTGGLEDSTL